MRKELLYNPRLLIERIAEWSFDKRRLSKLKGTAASGLTLTHITSMEFIEMAKESGSIKTIYDLGANVGTWSQLAKALIPGASIHAFEPIPTYQESYLASTKGLSSIRLHKVGAGSENKKEKFNFSGHSSSFLEVSENLLRMFPNEKKVGEITVDMVRLDDYSSKEHIPMPDLMKLDVEGYELEVLKHATECMKYCRYIILEVSFVERHIGQPLFHDVIHFMGQQNYGVCAFPYKMHLAQPIFQADVLFKNNAFKN